MQRKYKEQKICHPAGTKSENAETAEKTGFANFERTKKAKRRCGRIVNILTACQSSVNPSKKENGEKPQISTVPWVDKVLARSLLFIGAKERRNNS